MRAIVTAATGLAIAAGIYLSAPAAHAATHAKKAPAAQCSNETPETFAKELGDKSGKEYGAMALTGEMFAKTVSLIKEHVQKPEMIRGDGASFVAGDGNIFLAFTAKGKICVAMPITMSVVKEIFAGDKTDAPPPSNEKSY